MIKIKFAKKLKIDLTGDEVDCAGKFGVIVKNCVEQGHDFAYCAMLGLAHTLPKHEIIQMLESICDSVEDLPDDGDCEIIYPDL